MNGLALCSGVGGLELGLSAALPGYRCVGHVERDAYAAAVLVARMADAALDPAPVWDDLTTFPARAFRGSVDLISAGFPCQPWSVAGKRAGQDDDRWLWPVIARIIRDVGPRLVALENVRGLLVPDGIGAVLGTLADLGFDAEWTMLRASEVGAPHGRARVFILAYRRGDTRGEVRREQPEELASKPWRCGEGVADSTHGRPRRAGRGAEASDDPGAVADADQPRRERLGLEEPAGERSASGDEPDGCGLPQGGVRAGHVPNAERDALRVEPERGRRPARSSEPRDAESRDVGEDLPLWPPGPDGDWSGVPEWLWPAVEYGVRRMADGPTGFLDNCADRLRCLGNGCVPLQAAVAFRVLAARAGVLR